MEFIAQIFTEQWFIAGLLILIIFWIWFWFYKISKILISLLDKTLKSFLEQFWALVKWITDLTEKETESKKINSKEHKQNSEEHYRIIEILEAILCKLNPNADSCKNPKI